MFLCLAGLLFESFLRFKRQQLILASIDTATGRCPYILRAEDLALLETVVRAQQIALWSFGKAEAGDVGSFVPLAVMHEVKKGQVEESSKEVDKRLAAALKRLL